MSQQESRISRRIIERIQERGGFAFKVQAGPSVRAGLPDIVACYRGLSLWLETKVPGAPGATPIQLHVHEEIRAASGHVYVVRSVADVIGILNVLDTYADSLGLPVTAPKVDADAPNVRARVIATGDDTGSSQAISGPRRSGVRGWDS